MDTVDTCSLLLIKLKHMCMQYVVDQCYLLSVFSSTRCFITQFSLEYDISSIDSIAELGDAAV